MKTITIGQLVENLSLCDPCRNVFYDFGGLRPTKIMSWRGSYNEAAIGFQKGDWYPNVDMILTDLREAISGKVFNGYKGGDYTFTADTPLHVDNYGCYTSTNIVDLREVSNHSLIIITSIEIIE